MRFAVLLAALAWASSLWAQPVEFVSSNLPIVVIETDGQDIPDEPKITVRMGIIDNGPGARNHIDDAFTDYDGQIGIETRGRVSSQSFPKKQYGIETRDADGDDQDVSLLGLPEEEDWILNAPYVDKSLMRNVLTYGLARAIGRYASRTRYCELVLDGEYQGIYILMEKIKRDKDRLDISNLRPSETSGDDLTGGYIVQIDRSFGGAGWFSSFAGADSDKRPYYQYRVPSATAITEEQKVYIQAFIDDFEQRVDSPDYDDPETGYRSVVNLDSFVDYFLLTELSSNVDGYRLSTFLHKDKDSVDPRLRAGPLWDYNIAYGNANFHRGWDTQGLRVAFDVGEDYPVPFWWSRIVQSASFRAAASTRWTELRGGVLSDEALGARIDSVAALLGEAQERNFERWPILGRKILSNVYAGDTYAEEVEYLKQWTVQRATWLDGELGRTVPTDESERPQRLVLSAPAPNPSCGSVRLTLELPAAAPVRAEAFDVRGRRVATLHEGTLAMGQHPLTLDASALAPGLYLVRVRTSTGLATRRVVVMGR